MVRVGIFFQAGSEDEARKLLAAIAKLRFVVNAYRLGPRWEDLDGEEITFNFSSLSHVVIIPSDQSFKSRWLPFISGFALGGIKNLSFLIPTTMNLSKLPPYLRTASMFAEMNEFLDYLIYEGEIWNKANIIEQSREALISLGIGINENNFSQRVAMGDVESVEHFLHIGYPADTVDQGVSVLIVATRNGHRRVIDTLLAHGADVNIISEDRGNTALMEAAVSGDETSVRKFLEYGANPDIQNKSGQTSLMLAVGEGHKGVVKAILEYRPNIAIVDQLGMTAKKYADLFRHEEIIKHIEEYARTLVTV